MINPVIIFFMAALIVGGIIVIRTSRGTCGFCIFCGEPAKRIPTLTDEDQKHITQYFTNVEGRSVIPGAVIVCKSCNRIKDDRISAHTIHGTAMQCKSCAKAFHLKDSMCCPICGVCYRWQSFPEFGGFRFLVPYRKDKNANQSPGE